MEEKPWPLWLKVVAFIPAMLLIYLHVLGLVFVASIVGALIAGFGMENAFAMAYLGVAWKAYVGIGVFTFAFLSVLGYRHCCIGVQGYAVHMRKYGMRGIAADVIGAIIWPLAWYNVGRSLLEWETCLADEMITTVRFMLIDWWRKPPPIREIDDPELPGIRVYQVNRPEDLEALLREQFGVEPPQETAASDAEDDEASVPVPKDDDKRH